MTARATSRHRNPATPITRGGSTLYVHRMSKEEDRVARSRAAYFAGDRAGAWAKTSTPWAVYAVPAGASIGHLWRQELGRFATAAEAKACAATCLVPDFSEQLADLARRQTKEAKRRNPDPLAYGRGPIPPRVAQAAAAILGWDETERIVGPGLLGGASVYDLRRLVHAAKVERERQGGKPAITRRKPVRLSNPSIRDYATSTQHGYEAAQDIDKWSGGFPATAHVRILARAAGMPKGGDKGFWAGELYDALIRASGHNEKVIAYIHRLMS